MKRSAFGWDGMNNGIKYLKYHFYSLGSIEIQLHAMIKLTGL